MTSCGPTGEDAAEEHPRDRLRPERLARSVGGGEAIGLVGSGIEAAEHRADIEQQERAVQHGDAAEQSGEDAAGGADLQRAAPAQPPRQRADRQRSHPQTEDEDADRQRRQPLVRRKHGADDAGCRDQHRVVAAGERLRHRQHQRVAARQSIACEAVRLSFGERRHPHAPKRGERRRVFLLSRGVGEAPVPRDAELLGRMEP
jgi:hypothetical protein